MPPLTSSLCRRNVFHRVWFLRGVVREPEPVCASQTL
jgi:hypothetical protein